jgi:hypothetical protein
MRYLRMTIVSLFTAAAIILPVSPHAAAANTSIEAESMSVSPASAGRVIADSSASGGHALELSQNATASTNVSLSGSISVVIRAKGQSCLGAPSMSVLIDGKAISTTTVSATSWTNYTSTATITAGTHTLSIAFTNALKAIVCSRGLFLDTVTVATPTAATGTIAQYSNLSGAFVPAWISPVVAHPPELQTASTPYGQGFQFVVSDTADVATWDSAMKDVLGQKFPDNNGPMLTETPYTFNFYIYLPSQSIVTSWNGGVLWEFHTSASSGDHIGLDNTGRGPTNPSFRFGRQSARGENYTYTYAPLTFNTWHQFTLNFKWSTGTDGYYQLSMDGKQYINFSGQTIFSGEGTPYLQFGFYADIGSKNGVASVGNNQVTISGITYTTS